MPIWLLIAAPATFPRPGRILTTPGGKPASTTSSAKRNAVSDEVSAGLTMAVFPVASAGASLWAISGKEKFHGTMRATTPMLGKYKV